MKKVKIKIFPEEQEIIVPSDENLLKSLIEHEINIYSSCGGTGLCGKCKIKILSGEFSTEEIHSITHTVLISEEEKTQGIVLACLTKPVSDLEIEILEESRISYVIKEEKDEILTYSGTKFDSLYDIVKTNLWQLSSPIKCFPVKLPSPTLENSISDVSRILNSLTNNGIRNIIIPELSLVRSLPEKLRSNNWSVTLVLSEGNDVYPGNILVDVKENLKEYYGLAIDVGTTTVVVSLINLVTFEIIDTKTKFNQQMVYGDDIITRIIFSETSDGLEKLYQKVITTINDIINILVTEHKISINKIYTAVISGNTTMIHFLYTIPAQYIRREPYVPTISILPPVKAKHLGLMINSEGIVYSLPCVASYVGGDIVGGVISCGIDTADDGYYVLIDLGTNGEIVVGNKDFLICAACSCGPAFEGVGIMSGVRATDGAIENVKILDGDISVEVIGEGPPIGICGSGLITLPIELFRHGVIDRSGKFVKDIKNKFLSERVRTNHFGEKEFLIVEKEKTKNKKDIVITESDIINILRSKGAIFHGLYTLLKRVNLNFNDIKKIFISGNFGRSLDIQQAKMLGLLPDLTDDIFVVAGNTSLLGAKLFLCSEDVRKKIVHVAEKMTYIDLSTEPIFMNEYTSSLFIPHTDISLFPNVSKILNIAPK